MSAPPFSYFGGKTRLAARIVELLPSHGQYVEPFAGGLSVLLAKPRSNREVVNDLDGDLVTFWRVLRDRPDDLIRVCDLTPHAQAEYDACLDLNVADDLERARRVWCQLAQGRAGRLRGEAGWRVTVEPRPGADSHPARKLAGYVQRMPEVAERLRGVTLECRPATEVIERYGGHEETLIYADPPYLGSARAGASRRYRLEMLDSAEHRQLSEVLHSCRAAVVLSGFDSPEYVNLFGDWHSHRFVTTTNRGKCSTESVEVLWSNRPFRDQPSLLDLLDGDAS